MDTAALDTAHTWRSLLRLMPDYALITDLEGVVAFANRAPGALTVDDLVGRSVVGLAAPQHRAAFEAAVRGVAHGQPATSLQLMGNVTGRAYRVEVSPLRRNGDVVAVLIAAHDQQALRDSEARVEEERTRLEAMADAVPALIAFVDADGRYQLNNAGYAEWFDIDVRSIRGHTVREVVGEAGWANIRGYVERALAGEAVSFDMEVPYRRGGTRFVHADYVPHREPAGEPNGFFALITDITERRRLEEELHHARKLEALGRLAAGVAHDFNNLLMGIGGCAEMAARRLDAGDAAWSFLDQIRGSVARGSAVVNQLLTFARRRPFEPTAVAIDDLVVQTAHMLGGLAGPDVRIELALGAPRRLVYIDPAQLEQSLMNLVANARWAMPDGGTIEVGSEVVTVDAAQATAWDVAPGEMVRLWVEDTGIGMDEAVRARLFEPFFTTRAPGEGTGLGLASVYGAVKQAHGHITVASNPGRGTRFDLYLRMHGIAEDATAAPDRGARARRSPAPGATVLVIEDEQLVRQAVRAYLEAGGYRVVEAATGAEALARFAAEPIDAVVIDVVLPDMRGPRVLRELRRHEPGLRAVCMSGYAPEDGGDCGTGGAVRLQKPFGEPALLAAVDALFASPVRSILVVEDDEANRMVLEEVLRDEGYEVWSAASVDEALALAEGATGLDLIITDVRLGRDSGPRLVRELARRRPVRRVIYLSGLDPSDPDVRDALQISGASFLRKPIDLVRLLAVIASERAAH